MIKKGFKNVNQLNGGILNYLEKIPEKNSLWDGECFVFDNRVSVKNELKDGTFQLCHACRAPLSKTQIKSKKYLLALFLLTVPLTFLTNSIRISMLGYFISIDNIETFDFWQENKEQEKVIVSKLRENFNLPQSNQWGNTLVGVMSCSKCNAVHALHIDYGEVSNGHWQSSLHKVLLCNS